MYGIDPCEAGIVLIWSSGSTCVMTVWRLAACARGLNSRVWVPGRNRAVASASRQFQLTRTMRAVMPCGENLQPFVLQTRRRRRCGVASCTPSTAGPPATSVRIATRTSTSLIVPARGMRWTLREHDETLRRIPVPGRRSRLRPRVARVPRRHRHHQRVVVVDASDTRLASRRDTPGRGRTNERTLVRVTLRADRATLILAHPSRSRHGTDNALERDMT